MAFISILTAPADEHLRIVATAEPLVIPQPLAPDGTFLERRQLIVFQREVPDIEPLLEQVKAALATSRADPAGDAFSCPVPLAIRAIEVGVARLWPPHPVMCPVCQRRFVAPHGESRRMYLACPHCHNPLLNPRWDSA
jgi:hypothetical protein